LDYKENNQLKPISTLGANWIAIDDPDIVIGEYSNNRVEKLALDTKAYRRDIFHVDFPGNFS